MQPTVLVAVLLVLARETRSQFPTFAVSTTTTTVQPVLSTTPYYTSHQSVGQCTLNSQCVCTLDAPQDCDLAIEHQQITRAQQQVEKINDHLRGSVIDLINVDIASLLSRITTLESSLYNQSIAVSTTELAQLQDQLTNISSILVELSAERNTTVTQLLKAEVKMIQASLISLSTKSPIANKDEVDKEMARLRSRIQSCDVNLQRHSSNGLDFLGDALSYNARITADGCPSSRNLTVGEPVTHKFRAGINGLWLKDPMPVSDNVKMRIYEIQNYWANSVPLFYWDNLTKYEAFNSDSMRVQAPCLFHHHGTKSLILNGNLYWYDANVKRIGKQNMLEPAQCGPNFVLTSKYQITDAADNSYLGNTQTKADINYDETGLYAIYADTEGDLIVSKLNPATLEIEKTWETGKKKSSIANVFMVCGIVYSTDSFTSRHLSGAQWGFDTKTGEEFHIKGLDVGSAYGNLKQLSYNPRERLLFGWDNQHAVAYPVIF